MLSAVLRRSWRPGRLLQAPRAHHKVLRGALSSQPRLCERRFFATTPEDEEELPQPSSIYERVASEEPAQTAKKTLFNVGDHWTLPVWEDKVAPALRTFERLEGHFLVPQAFVVPSGDTRWPETTWGYQLGGAVKTLRHRQPRLKEKLPAHVLDDLAKMTFVWNVIQFKWDSMFMPALRHFREIHGHADVPCRFAVAKDDEEWPKLSRGIRLGAMVNSIRSRSAFPKQVAQSADELERLGFVSDSTLHGRDWKTKVFPSLEVFHSKHGHCVVKRPFVVPSAPPWPEKAWGMRLGSVVNSIRSHGHYAAQVAQDRDRLIEMRFAWVRSDAVWQENVLPALVAFPAKFGHCRVPRDFVVPREASWPEQAHGLRLGQILVDIRSYHGTYFAQVGRDADLLEEIGYDVRLHPKAWEQRVSPLLATYETLFPGEEIPKDFVIPSMSQWPEKRWGVRLGIIVSHNPHYLRVNRAEA
ncbi:hypothetical protein BBJ28_00013621 [Nothophytophthora sp. Chile5]|nr:hypothetical protein BBJ28_00013621 [Nothophytophthora sp. Chile5]